MEDAFSSSVSFTNNFSVPAVGRPFQADMPAVDGQSGAAGGQIFCGVALEPVVLMALGKFTPFAGEQYFHFPVKHLHGDRVLIGGAEVFLNKNMGGHERKGGNPEDGNGHEDFDDQRAALADLAGSEWRGAIGFSRMPANWYFVWLAYHKRPALMMEMSIPKMLKAMVATKTPFSKTSAVVAIWAVACSC